MSNPRILIESIEMAVKGAGQEIDPCTLSWVRQLKEVIDIEFPESIQLRIANVYRFTGRRGAQCRGVVTKQNEKTWVLYETVDSHAPGTRWMLHKTWCTKNNIRRDEAQSYELPRGLRIK